MIAIREIAMSVYRPWSAAMAFRFRPESSAKVKTLLQDLAIGLCLAPPLADHATFLSAAIWVATAMTVFTGAQYYLDGRRLAASRTVGHPGGPSDRVAGPPPVWANTIDGPGTTLPEAAACG